MKYVKPEQVSVAKPLGLIKMWTKMTDFVLEALMGKTLVEATVEDHWSAQIVTEKNSWQELFHMVAAAVVGDITQALTQMLLKFVNGSCLKSLRQILNQELITLNIAQYGQKMAFVQVIFMKNLWA